MNKVDSIREVRFLVDYKGSLRAKCKVAVSKKDASFYILPYSPNRKYYYGIQSFGKFQNKGTFDVKKQFQDDQIPKISFHQSGQVHVGLAERRAGPLRIPELSSLRGQHVATINAISFDGLLPYQAEPVENGPERDYVLPVADGCSSGRLAVFVNGIRPQFAGPCPIFLTLNRPTLSLPIYIGIAPFGQDNLSDISLKGIVAIGGWDPTLQIGDNQDFFFVRGE